MADQSDDDADFQRAWNGIPPQTIASPGPASHSNDDDEFQRAWSQDHNSPPAKGASEDYANMPWSQVAKTGVSNLPSSAWNSVKSVPQAALHPIDTANALYKVGAGGLSEAGIANHNPENEAAWDAISAPYRSVAGFKKALAEDPFSVLTTASIPFTGGAAGFGRAAEALGDVSVAGRAANAASKVSGAAATASNPLAAASTALGATGRLAGKAITGAQQFATGAPQVAFQTATAAGKASAAGNSDLANAFNTFAKGQGDPVDLSRKVSSAIQGMKSDAMNEWKQTKGNLANPPVDLSPVWQSIHDARANLSPKNVATEPALAAHEALDKTEGAIWDRVLSGNPEDTSLMGVDKLKQELYDKASGMYATPMASNALMGVHAGVRKALGDTSPEYNALMEQYQRMNDDIQNVTKSAGASNKTAASTELARLVRAQKTPDGQSMISRLGERDPTIPYMLAGAALHNTIAGGGSGLIEKIGGAGHAINVGRALLGGDPTDILTSASYPLIQGTVQSPRVMGAMNKGAGYAAGAIGNFAPVKGARTLTGMAATPGSIATSTNLSRAERELSGQPAFAAGGSVKKPSHEFLVNRLMTMVEKAKRAEKERTKPLLSVPDDTVANALAAAQRTI